MSSADGVLGVTQILRSGQEIGARLPCHADEIFHRTVQGDGCVSLVLNFNLNIGGRLYAYGFGEREFSFLYRALGRGEFIAGFGGAGLCILEVGKRCAAIVELGLCVLEQCICGLKNRPGRCELGQWLAVSCNTARRCCRR